MRRTDALAKAFRANMSQYMSGLKIPRQYHVVYGSKIHKISIVPPKYKEVSEYLGSDPRPFVRLDYEYEKWLFHFAGQIMDMSNDESCPLLCSKRDYENPGMSAFRVYMDGEFLQVQVRRTPEVPTLYQLDYFEPTSDNSAELQMVFLCDVGDPHNTGVDVVFAEGINKKQMMAYASKLSTVFRDILIYLRIWDYDDANKLCTVHPLPDKVLC